MNESSLKAALCKRLEEDLIGAVVMRHENRPGVTVGCPDISVTWRLRTWWFEVKYARPAIRSRGIQDVKIRQLAGVGMAYYVIYHEQGTIKTTRIAHPRDVDTPIAWRDGFNHRFVAEFIQQVHGG